MMADDGHWGIGWREHTLRGFARCCRGHKLTRGLQISAVKQKISDEKGWDPKQQKLIYSG